MTRNPLVFDPAHPDARGAATVAGGLYGDALRKYVLRRAPQLGLDPYVPLAVAPHEGGFAGAVGDQGSSFGPFQLHRGGALPAAHFGDARSWANSPEGVDYALTQLARTLRGRRGEQGVTAAVREFERPAAQYVPGEIAKATTTYRTLSANPAAAPATAPARTRQATDWTTALRSGARPQPRAAANWVAALSGATPAAKPASWTDALSGKPPASEPGPLPLAQPRTVTQPPKKYDSLALEPGVTLDGVNPQLLDAANRLANYLGKPLTVTSGYRDRAKQAALYQRYLASGRNIRYIAAAPGKSNHERGQALDLLIDGRPIALAVKEKILRHFGLHNPVPGDLPHTTLVGVNG